MQGTRRKAQGIKGVAGLLMTFLLACGAFAAEIEGVKLPRVWLGDQPADAALKKAMLGG